MAALGTVNIRLNIDHRHTGNQLDRREWPMAKSGREAEIRVYQDIGFEYSANQFIEQLNSLGEVDTLNIRINSVGGIVQEAVAMYQALARHPATKRVWVDAAAYSAASLLAMAASPGELRVAFNARMMIHNAWVIIPGDKHEMAKMAEQLDMLDGIVAATYAKRMKGTTKDEILALMDEETWYDADGAVAAGLADEVFQGDEQADLPDDAANMVSRFKHVPRDLLDRMAARASASESDGVADAVNVDARWAEIRQHRTA